MTIFLPIQSASLPPISFPMPSEAITAVSIMPAVYSLYPSFSVRNMARKGYTKLPAEFITFAINRMYTFLGSFV